MQSIKKDFVLVCMRSKEILDKREIKDLFEQNNIVLDRVNDRNF